MVTLCASIPNPLFDLAGLACGHFLIPFHIFFGATMIGKAIVKVSIQCAFVIVLFNDHHLENIIGSIESFLPNLQKGSLMDNFEKQKRKLYEPVVSDGPKPIIGQLWDYFILAMVLYFVVSIVNSLVADYLEKKHEERKKQLIKAKFE
jgi:hypothetical protein